MSKRNSVIFHNGEPLVCIECLKFCEGEEGKDWMRLPNGGYIHTGRDESTGGCWRSYLVSLKENIYGKKETGQRRLF